MNEQAWHLELTFPNALAWMLYSICFSTFFSLMPSDPDDSHRVARVTRLIPTKWESFHLVDSSAIRVFKPILGVPDVPLTALVNR